MPLPASSQDPPGLSLQQRANARLGLRLFSAYALFYACFVFVNAFVPDLVKQKPLAGINLAVWWGLALIGLACLLAVAYGLLCKTDQGSDVDDAEHRDRS